MSSGIVFRARILIRISAQTDKSPRMLWGFFTVSLVNLMFLHTSGGFGHRVLRLARTSRGEWVNRIARLVLSTDAEAGFPHRFLRHLSTPSL